MGAPRFVDGTRRIINAWYSSRPPTRLRVVAAYFALSGAFALATAALYGGRTLSSGVPRGTLDARLALALGLLVAYGIGLLQTARLLWRRSREAAYWAIGSLLVFGALWLAGNEPTFLDVLLVVGALALIAASWRDLRG